jgi:hypothetical protein
MQKKIIHTNLIYVFFSSEYSTFGYFSSNQCYFFLKHCSFFLNLVARIAPPTNSRIDHLSENTVLRWFFI